MIEKIVSIYPEDIASRYGGGHWKAIQSFHQLINQLGKNIEEIGINSDPHSLLDEISKYIKENDCHIVFHYSFWPYLIKQLKHQNSNSNIVVRTINAEGFQHWQRSNIVSSLSYSNLRNIYGSLRLIFQDQQCRFYANSLLGISQWDNQHYWKFLPGKAEIIYTPYHCPWPELRPHIVPLPWEQRCNTIVCLPGGRDPIGKSQVQNFIHFSRTISQGNLNKKWNFELSPGVYRNQTDTDDISPVTLMTELHEPWDLLCSVKALALLTPLGFGTKTTIIDALAAGCHVLVDKTLAQRLDPDVRSLCLIVDMTNPKTMINAMTKLQLPPSQNNINSILKEKAINSIQSLFL